MEILLSKKKDSDLIGSANKVGMTSVNTNTSWDSRNKEDQLTILQEIRRKKQETQIIFYDYITDQKEDQANLILCTPFMDFMKLIDIEQAREKHEKYERKMTRLASKDEKAGVNFKGGAKPKANGKKTKTKGSKRDVIDEFEEMMKQIVLVASVAVISIGLFVFLFTVVL